MSFVGNKPAATLPPSAGMVKSDGLNLQTAVAGTDYMTAATGVNGSAFSFRNKIINGKFNIWQRDSGTTGIGVEVYGPDRFLAYQASQPITWVLSTFTAGQTDVPDNPTNYARCTFNSSGTGGYLGQKVEDVRTLAGQVVTLSFYIKGNAARTATVHFRQNFGSGGSTTVDTAGTTNAVTITNGTWTKITTTLTLPSISGKIIGANSYLGVFIESFSSAGFQCDIANWQLEPGSVATPFETRPYGTELSLCQRYLPAFIFNTATEYIRAPTLAYTLAGQVLDHFPVQDRLNPTSLSKNAVTGITITSGAGSSTSTGVAYNTATSQYVGALSITLSGATVGGGLAYSNQVHRILFNGCEL